MISAGIDPCRPPDSRFPIEKPLPGPSISSIFIKKPEGYLQISSNLRGDPPQYDQIWCLYPLQPPILTYIGSIDPYNPAPRTIFRRKSSKLGMKKVTYRGYLVLRYVDFDQKTVIQTLPDGHFTKNRVLDPLLHLIIDDYTIGDKYLATHAWKN